jgi:hypothetical protein
MTFAKDMVKTVSGTTVTNTKQVEQTRKEARERRKRTACAVDGLLATLVSATPFDGHQYEGAKTKYQGCGTCPSVGNTWSKYQAKTKYKPMSTQSMITVSLKA